MDVMARRDPRKGPGTEAIEEFRRRDDAMSRIAVDHDQFWDAVKTIGMWIGVFIAGIILGAWIF